ncbi:hypothetical protein [Gordonia sp. ABSL49_1]|uniref:hypothetical protein n=1 Tax=Gordonia sp. ABSL49_1 TaxID=2920941 RepID=UPI001F107046|nr:hypothetical protein [Gordonia sp. ABSL49_1]MCH5644440.1 hypothetical protein [Gordonia sp. ABSL49_1]
MHLHTQRATADYIIGWGGHFVVTVECNQPTLLDQLKSLPWNRIGPSTTNRFRPWSAHTRTIKAVEGPAHMVGLDHVGQVIQIRRNRTIKGKRTVEIVRFIGDLDMLASRPQLIADWAHGSLFHRNRLHYVRDVTFAEDASQIRTGAGLRVMATLRNAEQTNIAAALRQMALSTRTSHENYFSPA